MKRRFELSNARYEIVKSLDEVKKLGLWKKKNQKCSLYENTLKLLVPLKR
jgi:hypothetical protein